MWTDDLHIYTHTLAYHTRYTRPCSFKHSKLEISHWLSNRRHCLAASSGWGEVRDCNHSIVVVVELWRNLRHYEDVDRAAPAVATHHQAGDEGDDG